MFVTYRRQKNSEMNAAESVEVETATVKGVLKTKLDHVKPYFGEFSAGQDFLREKSDCSLWVLLKLIDAILRGIAQVCFANNPVSGLLILIGLGLGGYAIAIGAIVGPFVAIVTSVILDQPRANIENGLYQFNACLVGTVIPSLYPLLYKGDLGVFTWIMIVFMSAMTVPIQSGLANVLGSISAHFKVKSGNSRTTESRSLVGLTFPFNVVTTVAMFILVSYKNVYHFGTQESDNAINNEDINWLMVLQGIVVSGGQVYAALTLPGSVLTYIGFFIYSPYLALVSFAGAAIGSFVALLFSSFPYSMVYDGIWGYCPILTAGALACTFYEQNWRTAILAVLACVFTTGMQAAMAMSTATIGLPIFTLPFVFTTWLVMILNSENLRINRR